MFGNKFQIFNKRVQQACTTQRSNIFYFQVLVHCKPYEKRINHLYKICSTLSIQGELYNKLSHLSVSMGKHFNISQHSDNILENC